MFRVYGMNSLRWLLFSFHNYLLYCVIWLVVVFAFHSHNMSLDGMKQYLNSRNMTSDGVSRNQIDADASGSDVEDRYGFWCGMLCGMGVGCVGWCVLDKG